MIVSAAGLAPDDEPLTPLADAPPEGGALRLIVPNDTRAEALAPLLPRCLLIAIPLPGFADGRAFSLAGRLRALGYGGTLRATGAPIPDQLPALLACGFDEVQVPDPLAERQTRRAWAEALAAPRPPRARRLGRAA